MKVSLQDSVQMHRDFYAVFPRDLVEDLSDEDPQLEQNSESLDRLLSAKRQEIEKKEEASLPDLSLEEAPVRPVLVPDTLVKTGWDKISHKHQKNWADFENLIALYTLGKLFCQKTMPAKALQDKKELTYVVEEFDRIRKPRAKKHFSAAQRLSSTKTYIDFGKRTINASCLPNAFDRAQTLNEIENEYIEAIHANQFNGWKLKKAYHISRRVIKKLRQRYL